MEDNIRAASHAGSWYNDNKNELLKEFKNYLDEAKVNDNAETLKGMIVPHAGYRFSGQTAAWAYKNINPNKYNRVVLLGPSHHAYIPGCGLTTCTEFETPLGNIKIDMESSQKLLTMEGFFPLDKSVDEKEHSLEMQLPYLRLMFEDRDFTLLPIMVGNTTLEQDKYFAEILAEFYKDEKTLFVISSDFCHWGKRFNFTYTNGNYSNIYESIEYLDKLGMSAIESLDPVKFHDYLVEHKNTICGRKPISIFMCIIQEVNVQNLNNIITFVCYNQSEQVTNVSGSSVSYAVGLNVLVEL